MPAAFDDLWCAGKGALRKKDRPKVRETGGWKVRRSALLDTSELPWPEGSRRWDYLADVERGRQRCVAGIEVHPAVPREVAVVRRKKEDARALLRDIDGPVVARWYWVASRGTALSRTTAEYRQLVLAGIRFVGGVLDLGRDRPC